MASVEKISIALPPEMVSLVRQAVETGEYASSSEVVRDALRDWSHKRNLCQQGIEELRNGNLWQFGGSGNDSSVLNYGSLDDLWEYNPSTGEWAWIAESQRTAALREHDLPPLPKTVSDDMEKGYQAIARKYPEVAMKAQTAGAVRYSLVIANGDYTKT
jgi:antitoxin ParD1/3/4